MTWHVRVFPCLAEGKARVFLFYKTLMSFVKLGLYLKGPSTSWKDPLGFVNSKDFLTEEGTFFSSKPWFAFELTASFSTQ